MTQASRYRKEITAFLQARRAARSPDRRPRLRQTRDQERVASLSLPLSASEAWRVSSLAGFVVASMSVTDERPPMRRSTSRRSQA